MEKRKQSKKRWARTEAQGRNDYHNHWIKRRNYIPKWFLKTFSDANERKVKMAMHDINSGVEPEDVFFTIRYRVKSTAAWWWL